MLHAVKAGARGRHEASLPASMFIFPTVLNAERFADSLVFLQVSSPSRAFGRQVSVAFGSVARLFASQQLKSKPLPTEVKKKPPRHEAQAQFPANCPVPADVRWFVPSPGKMKANDHRPARIRTR